MLWCDAKEIKDLWDTELAAEITGAADAEELFNIVQHLDEPEPLELVLSSAALDQGTALLVYWRLRNISGLWRAVSEIMARVEQIIAAGTLPAVLAYDPAADPENKELRQRARWSVPEVFMQPTHG